MAEVFRTIHGSHLYGFAHDGSDQDIYIVTDKPGQRMRQAIHDGEDVITVGWGTLLDYALSGSHQSCEAVFSTRKAWTPEGERLKPLIEGLRIQGGDVAAKYERTIRKFCYGDYKRRRHAVRLAYNLADLRHKGRFDPTLSPSMVRYASNLARYHKDDDLAALLNVRN